MKQNRMLKYLDGYTDRMHNKRVSVVVKNGDIICNFAHVDKEGNKPACLHTDIKNVGRYTSLKLSQEGAIMLAHCLIKLLNDIENGEIDPKYLAKE